MACSDISSCIASYYHIYDNNQPGQFRLPRFGRNHRSISIAEARLIAHGTFLSPRTRGVYCPSRQRRLNIGQKSVKGDRRLLCAPQPGRNGPGRQPTPPSRQATLTSHRIDGNRQTRGIYQGRSATNRQEEDTSRRCMMRCRRSWRYIFNRPLLSSPTVVTLRKRPHLHPTLRR